MALGTAPKFGLAVFGETGNGCMRFKVPLVHRRRLEAALDNKIRFGKTRVDVANRDIYLFENIGWLVRRWCHALSEHIIV